MPQARTLIISPDEAFWFVDRSSRSSTDRLRRAYTNTRVTASKCGPDTVYTGEILNPLPPSCISQVLPFDDVPFMSIIQSLWRHTVGETQRVWGQDEAHVETALFMDE